MQRCCLVYTSVLLQKKCTDGAHFDLNPRVNLQVLLTNSPLEQLHNSASQWAGSWAQSFPASWLCRNQIVLRSILATVSSYVQVISPSAFLDRSCPTNLATRQRFRHAHKVKKNKNLCCRYKEGASSHWVIRKGEEHMVAGVNCMEIPCPSTENTLLHMHQATQKCKTKIERERLWLPLWCRRVNPPECSGFISDLLSQSRMAPTCITSGQSPRAPWLSEAPVGHCASRLQHFERHQPRGWRCHRPHGFCYNCHEEPFHCRGMPHGE